MKWAPGELDQRITVRRQTLTPDGMGGNTKALSDVVTVWAKVIPLAGRESSEHGRLEASNVYRFVIRNRQNLLPSDCIIWRGTQFNIRALPVDGGRGMYLEIDAERGVI